MPKLMIGLEQKLKEYAEQDPAFERLWSSWQVNKQILEELLQVTIGLFPHYSRHDVSHCRSVLNNIEMVLGDSRINQLEPTDIWILLNAVYSHDIGMIGFCGIKNEWQSDDFRVFVNKCCEGDRGAELKKHAQMLSSTDKAESFDKWSWDIHIAAIYLIAEYHRKSHASRSCESILAGERLDLSVNGLIPKRFIVWIAKIVQSHGEDFNSILQLKQRDNGFCRDTIHPRFIAALLCLGDALDMDNSRFHSYSDLIVGERDSVSELHYKKHEAIRQLLITPDYIEISADCGSTEDYHETYRALREWCDMLSELLKDIALNWNRIIPEGLTGTAPILNEVEYIVDGKKVDPELAKLRFEISQERAFELVQGSNIYENENSFIRELIQNAMDSSKIQFWQDVKGGCFSYDEIMAKEEWGNYGFQPYHIKNTKIFERYSIEINLEPLSCNNIRIIVRDSGIGFDEFSLREMSCVGNSYRIGTKKEYIKDMPQWLKPTGCFGIGLQSLFLVCDEFSCRTRSRRTGISYEIKFHSRSSGGYLDVIDLGENHAKYGAEFTVCYKSGYFTNVDFFGKIFKEEVQRLYNRYDYFLGNSVENGIAQIGALNAYIYISDNVSDVFFPVKICLKNDDFEKKEIQNNIKSNDILENIIKINQEESFAYGDYLTKINFNDLSCIIWDLKSHSYLCFGPTQKKSSVFYKGIWVGRSSLSPDLFGFGYVFSLFGYETDKALTLNRERLTHSAEASIKVFFKKALSVFCRILVENFDKLIMFFEKKQDLKNNQDFNYVWYLILLLLFFEKRDYCRKFLERLEWFDYEVIAYVCKDNHYIREKLSVRDAVKSWLDNNRIFFGRNLSEYDDYGYDSKLLDFVAPLVKEKGLSTENIYVSYLLREYLVGWYGKTVFLKPDIGAFLSMNIPEKSSSIDTDFRNFVDTMYKSIYRESSRIILTNCLEPYDKLSLDVDKLNNAKHLGINFILSVERYFMGVNSGAMIIPVGMNILSRLGEQYCLKDSFVNEITSSERYAKILNFTLENQFYENRYTTYEIDSSYKQILGDIFDLFKKSV